MKLNAAELAVLQEFAPKEEPIPVVVRKSDHTKFNTVQHLYSLDLVDCQRFRVVGDRFFFQGYTTEKGDQVLGETNV